LDVERNDDPFQSIRPSLGGATRGCHLSKPPELDYADNFWESETHLRAVCDDAAAVLCQATNRGLDHLRRCNNRRTGASSVVVLVRGMSHL
jgi:hypothetical protein